MYMLCLLMPDGDSYVYETPVCVSPDRETLVARAVYELVDVIPEMADYGYWIRNYIRKIDVV